ncbi:DUF1853 family protein [Halomonas sp. HP20-15]|uniref:DUF1853 family protein n=1 Tax=Halomonas sp. HP20-15 TaxID=3085901 RepID=UPI0029819475|nr:DUF1853 family protein [Halomonas sp. HP20-15]MDW5378148.1 DUF1853 family protein [Halomonas sp. HP20-15]
MSRSYRPETAPGDYRHPLVRDLAWLLDAPDMLVTAYPGRPTLTELGLADPDRKTAWLDALEDKPGGLEKALDTRRAGRLGLYHEALWHFLLTHAPGTRLLGANLAVHDSRGMTLGEFDLLYASTDDAAPIHLELAIKYYLGLTDGPGPRHDAARWIGPGCADSLAIKWQRALAHQLPLAHRPEAAATLERFSMASPGRPLEQRLAILGVLFQPWRGDASPLPPGIHADALLGEWLYHRDWPDFCATLGNPESLRGAFLDKPHWLAPPPDSALLPLTALSRQLDAHFAARQVPRQLLLHEAGGTYRRLFVVADDWPRAIPLPPRVPCNASA